MKTTEDYYHILGLDSSATPEDIKQAYRDLVQINHPDRYTDNPRLQKKAEEQLKRINAAYEAINKAGSPQQKSKPQGNTAARERETRERETRERETKERETRERETKERETRERETKERETKERETKEHAAKERAARERAAGERAARERAAREPATGERGEAKAKAKTKTRWAAALFLISCVLIYFWYFQSPVVDEPTVTTPDSMAQVPVMVQQQSGNDLNITLPGGVPLEMVAIPAGSFMMGSNDGEDDEKPVHRVTISKPFYMGKYEVTQAQWQAVMGNNPSRFKGANNPVENVSWNDCQEFIKKLNVLGQGTFRLPTEAEWEYACRAGTTTKYYWGDSETLIGDYAWYSGNSGSTTHPVGQKRPNYWGLYDMSGNVWEWCQDWYGIYPSGSVVDPIGQQSGSDRVFRGGSWYDYAWFCRSADRGWFNPGGGNYYLGFRIVLSRTQ